MSGLLARGFCSFSRRSPVNVLQTTHLIPDKVQGFSSAQLRPAEAHAVFLAEKVLLGVLGCCSLPGQGWVQQLSRSDALFWSKLERLLLLQQAPSRNGAGVGIMRCSWGLDREQSHVDITGTRAFCPLEQQGLRLKTHVLRCSAANCSTKAKTKKKII